MTLYRFKYYLGKLSIGDKSLKMWHEARRQEKKLRGMMVDYRKRAERRRAFYERMVGLHLHVYDFTL